MTGTEEIPSSSRETLAAGVKALAVRLGLIFPDEALLALMDLAELPEVLARRLRQGVTLIYAGEDRLTALLVYQGRAWGLFVHRPDVALPELLDDLKEFRLGWLPTEVVRGQEGLGSVFAGEMPAEAEGFVPAFVTGRLRGRLAGQGKLVPPVESGS